MDANERGETARAARPALVSLVSLVSLAAFTAIAVAGATGCLFAPSPDDAWSADFGRPVADGSAPPIDAAIDAGEPAPGSEAGAVCASRAKTCATCCDSAFGAAAGADVYAIVFRCVCPATTCLVCGVCGGDPAELNDPCVDCLAANARAKSGCTSGPLAQKCGAGTPCHDYAACLFGCEP